MSLTFPLRAFAGMPVAGTLKAPGLSNTDGAGVTIESSTPLLGWTNVTGSAIPAGAYMCLTFGYGTASEEKILCTFNESTSVFTIVQRHYEGTTSYAWATGSLFVLTWTATEAAELNAVTQSLKTILTNSGSTSTPQPITIGSGTGGIGSGVKPAAIDHDHKISVSTLNGFLGGSDVSATLGANVTLPATQVGSGLLPVGVTASQVWRDSGTGAAPASITGITGYSKYIVMLQSEWTSGTTTGDNQTYITANATNSRSAYGRSFGSIGSHSSASIVASGADFGVSSSATTFNAVVTVNNITGTSNAHTLTVIGIR